MNKFLRTVSFSVLISSLVFLSACFNDSETVQTENLNPDVGADVGEQGSLGSSFSFRAIPKITEIKISWDTVTDAKSYEVSRQLEGGAVVIESTINPQLIFSTGEEETYEVWVAALDENGGILEKSLPMNVTTGSSASLLISDEGI